MNIEGIADDVCKVVEGFIYSKARYRTTFHVDLLDLVRNEVIRAITEASAECKKEDAKHSLTMSSCI